MKVLVSLADSATLKTVEFSKSTDTSRHQSEQPQIEEVISGGAFAAPKKRAAILHLAQFKDGRVAVARKNGDIAIGDEKVGHIDGEIVGLYVVTNQEILLVFASTGHCVGVSSRYSTKFQIRDGLSTVVQNPQSELQFASAGAEKLPDIFELVISDDGSSIDVQEPVWAATQPPNDVLDLPERNLVSGLAFVDPGLLVAVTSHGRLRVYDVQNSSGQPEHIVQVSKDGFKSIAADPGNKATVLVGDSRSRMSRWSLDPPKLLGNYKDVNGSTRSISVRGSYVACGGLDRYLRVFDVAKRQLAGKVYVKDEIWSVKLVRTDDEEEAKELDEFWEEIDSKPKRRKVEPTKPLKYSETHSKDEDSEYDSESDGDGSFEGFDD